MFLACTIFLASCGDEAETLSGGYTYRLEGSASYIGHKSAGRTGKIIPCDVLDYDYNEDFVIVSQKPNPSCPPDLNRDDALHSGYDINYWIADNRRDELLGPLSLEDFMKKREELSVPDKLQLRDPK